MKLGSEEASNLGDLKHLRHAFDEKADVLQDAGLQPDRFWRVIGYSDRVPLEGVKPESEENRRITIVARLQPDTAKTLSSDDVP